MDTDYKDVSVTLCSVWQRWHVPMQVLLTNCKDVSVTVWCVVKMAVWCVVKMACAHASVTHELQGRICYTV